MCELKIPGKLMLAGEYAVTVPGHLAIVFAIDRFISKKGSQLVNKKGIKYGLGSSGAYAVFKTKSQYPALLDDALFKKSLQLSRQTQIQNSGADIAASTFSGLLIYQNGHLPKSLLFPNNWQLLVGWTGTPAVTSKLVKINQLSENFLAQSDLIVQNMIAAIREQNFNLFSQQLILAEKNLETLKGVLTDKLAKAIQIARQFDVAAKISGAGGGDNVIAFAQDKKIVDKIKQDWRKAGIIPLDLHVYYKK